MSNYPRRYLPLRLSVQDLVQFIMSRMRGTLTTLLGVLNCVWHSNAEFAQVRLLNSVSTMYCSVRLRLLHVVGKTCCYSLDSGRDQLGYRLSILQVNLSIPDNRCNFTCLREDRLLAARTAILSTQRQCFLQTTVKLNISKFLT